MSTTLSWVGGDGQSKRDRSEARAGAARADPAYCQGRGPDAVGGSAAHYRRVVEQARANHMNEPADPIMSDNQRTAEVGECDAMSEQTTLPTDDRYYAGQLAMAHRAAVAVIQSGLSFDRELLEAVAEKILGIEIVGDPLPPTDNTTEVIRLRGALERCHRVLHFDLRRMIEFGPDYNQAVKDVADVVRHSLKT